MSRGAWGYEWAIYHKERQKYKWDVQERKKERPAIYLLYKLETSSASYVVKVGQTARNALQRLEEQKNKGYDLLVHWWIREELLLECESLILQAFKEKYGSPVEGREAFRVKNKAEAQVIAESEVAKLTQSAPGE